MRSAGGASVLFGAQAVDHEPLGVHAARPTEAASKRPPRRDRAPPRDAVVEAFLWFGAARYGVLPVTRKRSVAR